MVTKVVTKVERPQQGGLTPHFVRTVTRPGRYGDGHGGFGLSLHVKPATKGRLSKTWNQRLPIEAGKRETGLGAYPAIPLHSARQQALDNWQRVKAGEDILATLAAPIPIPIVSEGFDAVIATRRQGWRTKTTEKSWRRYQRKCESILAKPVSEVTTADVTAIIEPIWHKIPTEAKKIRIALHAVMQWSIIKGHRPDNPALPYITEGMGKQKPTTHHPSVPYRKLGEVLRLVKNADAPWAVKACLLFLVFTISRSRQAREAKWHEIDFDNAAWTIPGSRMKSGIPHTVPLCSQAIDLLIDAQDRTGSSHGLIFPPEANAQHIYAYELSELLHSVRSPAVPHGMRSSFRNWSGRTKGITHNVAEAAMAHSHDKVVAAYLTDDYVEERIELMQLWGDFLTAPVINATPSEKGETRPKIKSKDEPATGAEPHFDAVPGTDQQAGTPANRTTATTAGRTTKRRHPAQALATVNGRPPKGPKQRTKAFHQPGLQFVETRP